MNIHERALSIYNSLPNPAKPIAAQKYGVARWYFKNIIGNVNTDEISLFKTVECMEDALDHLLTDLEEKSNQIKSNSKILKDELRKNCKTIR